MINMAVLSHCLALALKYMLIASQGVFIGSSAYLLLDMFSKDNKDPIDWEVIKVNNSYGERPKLVSVKDNTYIYELPNGIIPKDIEKNKEYIENMIDSRIEMCRYGTKLEIRKIVDKYDDCYKTDLRKEPVVGMKINIGKKLNGDTMYLDLGGNECHTLVCGSTGSGKSVFLNVLVSQMILRNVDMYIIDFKKVEYILFSKYDNLKSISYTLEQCESVLESLVREMDYRYSVLATAGYKNYKDYNSDHKENPMKPIFVLIDEFSVIPLKSQCNKYLYDLLARCRACNMLITLATQRPDSNVISGGLKCNIKNTVIFSCETKIDSEVALGRGNYMGAEITESGVGIVKIKGKFEEFKGYYFKDSELKNMVKDKLNTDHNFFFDDESTNTTIEVNKKKVKEINNNNDIDFLQGD